MMAPAPRFFSFFNGPPAGDGRAVPANNLGSAFKRGAVRVAGATYEVGRGVEGVETAWLAPADDTAGASAWDTGPDSATFGCDCGGVDNAGAGDVGIFGGAAATGSDCGALSLSSGVETGAES